MTRTCTQPLFQRAMMTSVASRTAAAEQSATRVQQSMATALATAELSAARARHSMALTMVAINATNQALQSTIAEQSSALAALASEGSDDTNREETG